MRRQSILVSAVVSLIAALGVCECAFADLASPSGSIVAWGSNTYGKLTVPSGDNFVAISTGGSSALALRSDGTLVAWPDVYRAGSVLFPPGNDYVSVAGGAQYPLALRADGSLVAWEYPGSYNCAPPGNDFVAISGGYYHLALRADGSLVSWDGYSGHGPPSGMPVESGFTAISAGQHHGLAIRADRSLVGWGLNDWGQIDVPSGNDYAAVAANGHHSLALRADGTIVAWGWDGRGQTNVPSGNDFISISAGSTWSLALRSDGSLVAWGDERYTGIPTGNDFFAIAADSDFGVALSYRPYVGPVQPVPVPGAALLGVIGLGYSGWRLRRRTARRNPDDYVPCSRIAEPFVWRIGRKRTNTLVPGVLVLLLCGATHADMLLLDAPGATLTNAWGINGDQIVGYYNDGVRDHAFLYQAGGWTTLDAPGAELTEPQGIEESSRETSRVGP